MSVINAIPMLLGGEGYEISRSVRLRSSASAYFNRTPASAGNRSTWTWSGWVKRGVLGSSQNTLFAVNVGATDTTYFQIAFGTVNPDCLLINSYNITSLGMQTAAVFRDPSAWYHVVFALDTTQATASNRMKLYVNGVQQTSFLTYINYPALNSTFAINTAAAHNIGASNAASNFDGYMTEVNFIDGQQLTPSSFGETDAVTGVWKPKKYAGTYGTNGFYLNFSDNSSNTATTIGKDYSGNGNNWTPNNISVTAGATYDSMLDVPTMWADGGNGRGNYAVLNPLNYVTTLPSGGNLTWNLPSGGNARVYGSMGVSTGKWYFETTITAFNPAPFNGYMLIGISYTPTPSGTGRYTYIGSNDSGIAGYKNNGATSSAYGANYTVGDVVGVAYDLDAGTITFYKNGTSQGTAFTGIAAGEYFPVIINDGGASNPTTYNINFGQRPFSYTPPTGFKALNTQNLPESTIKAGNKFFDVSTWTGNGTSQSIVNSGAMQPDLVWAKQRSSTQWHRLVDAVRGTDKVLYSNDTSAEFTDNTQLTSFNSNGFSVGSQAGFNANAATYVGWQWKAGGAAVSNTAGSITTQVSGGAAQGFSVATYISNGVNGATIGHGLGVAPKMVIIKCRYPTTTQAWAVYHASLGATQYLNLNSTAAAATLSTYWNNTAPSSSVVTLGTHNDVNINGSVFTYVAYLFAEVAGFSKFGSYTGNGSADGPFLYLGFRPRWLMYKRTDSTGQWNIIDTSRDLYNPEQTLLRANLSNADEVNSVYAQDFTSNGWKIRSTNVDVNTSGGTYIYAAFAENPFKNSLAR